MSGTDPWAPVHHELVEDADDQPAQAATKPREPAKHKETHNSGADSAIPLTLVMGIPPELIAALSSLAGTMERIATSVEAQGKAILELAKAMSKHDGP